MTDADYFVRRSMNFRLGDLMDTDGSSRGAGELLQTLSHHSRFLTTPMETQRRPGGAVAHDLNDDWTFETEVSGPRSRPTAISADALFRQGGETVFYRRTVEAPAQRTGAEGLPLPRSISTVRELSRWTEGNRIFEISRVETDRDLDGVVDDVQVYRREYALAADRGNLARIQALYEPGEPSEEQHEAFLDTDSDPGVDMHVSAARETTATGPDHPSLQADAVIPVEPLERYWERPTY